LFEKLKAWAREPLVHFLIIGAGIYALYGVLAGGEGPDNERTVFVSASDISSLEDQFVLMRKRPPTEAEFSDLIRSHVRVKILHREALAMGLDVGDTAIERRLAQKVEMLARSLITPDPPTVEEMRTWYDANPDAFKQADRYSIAQVFFDPGKRDDSTLDDARVALDKLSALNGVPEDLADYGDRLMLQNYYSEYSEFELGRLFGEGFVDQIADLQPGQWHGPVRSGYGIHLVWVEDIQLSPPPPLDEVKEQVAGRWMAEQIDEMSGRFVDELVSRYEVVVEEVEVPMIPDPNGAAP
jgi:peptidyl-prolyl cis-trans isomerase C